MADPQDKPDSPGKAEPKWKLPAGYLYLLYLVALAGAVYVLASRKSVTLVWVSIWLSLGLLAGGLLLWRWLVKAKSDKPLDKADVNSVCITLCGVLGVGTYAIYGACAYIEPADRAYGVLLLLMWSLGLFLLGFLLGFLFGMPKVSQGEAKDREYSQSVNTNLEQISDWLTKIIVGLGLVQLRQVPAKLEELSLWVAKSVPAKATALENVASFATAQIISFSIAGFLAGYLLTRLRIARSFHDADTGRDGVNQVAAAAGQEEETDVKKLMGFVMPGGNIQGENERKLLNWIRQNNLGEITWPTFVIAKEFAQKRKTAIVALGIT